MPARRIGWRTERRVVRGVVIVGTGDDEAIVAVGAVEMSEEGGRRLRGVRGFLIGLEDVSYSNVRRAAFAR